MAATSNISVLLKHFATKQNSPFVIYKDFCDYMKRYAQHNVEELPELVTFLGSPEQAIDKELNPLIETKQVAILDEDTPKQSIFVLSFFVSKFYDKYKEIQNNPTIPFPTLTDFPKLSPLDILNKQNCQDIIMKLMADQDKNDKEIYSILLHENVPPVVFPGCVPIKILVDSVMEKIRRMLKKDEYHDYYLKKLRISNPGKEIASKNFFTAFLSKPEMALRSLESSGDSFYFWNQLCYFIKQDYEKVKDFTQEDINVLQSVYIAEIIILYYKNVAQKNLQRETALNTLQKALVKPPYYFSMDSILRFTDSKEIPLLGQYSEDDLKEFLKKQTTESKNNELPVLLVLKTENQNRYFIYKTNVISLILKLANDCHTSLTDRITKIWYKKLQNFEKIPEVYDEVAFNEFLEQQIRIDNPILYALLKSSFLPILNTEFQTNKNATEDASIFDGDELISYSGLLQLNKTELLESARILLPIWYLIPILSWIIALFTKKKTKKQKKLKKKKTQKNQTFKEIVNEEDENSAEKNSKRENPPLTKKDAFIRAAREVEKGFVPLDSTIEKEIVFYKKQWNKMISKQANENLTEDVNALIRDYMRKVFKTLPTKNFTTEQITELASTLCNTPGMQKIGEKEALLHYVELYIIFIAKNL